MIKIPMDRQNFKKTMASPKRSPEYQITGMRPSKSKISKLRGINYTSNANLRAVIAYSRKVATSVTISESTQDKGHSNALGAEKLSLKAATLVVI